MKVLMIGVDKTSIGGMLTVIENYLEDYKFCKTTNLIYISTVINKSKIIKIIYFLKQYFKILNCLSKENIDIMHIHMGEKGSVFREGFVVLTGKLFKCKTIIHMHSGPFIYWYNKQNKIVKKIIRIIINSSDKFIVLGEYWKETLKSIIQEEKITVLYNSTTVVNKNTYNCYGNKIIYMGLIKKEKGAWDLLNAIKLIDNELSCDIKVVLCGADVTGTVLERIHSLGLDGRVKYLGWIDNKTKLKLYNQSILNILPSYFEGLSMTVIEAMAHGIPTITTKISTMPEILGKNANLVEVGKSDQLAEKIIKLVNNNSLRIKISNREYLRARKFFNIDNNLNRLYGIYKELLQEK